MDRDVRLNDILEIVAKAVYDAFVLGQQVGAAEMRDNILRAAQVPVREPPTATRAGSSQKKSRVARGTVAKFIKRMMAERQGWTQTELEAAAQASGEEMSNLSIGNELRRFEGVRYRRDEQRRWFLVRGEDTVHQELAGASH